MFRAHLKRLPVGDLFSRSISHFMPGLFWTAQGDPEISLLRLRFSTWQSISHFTPLYDKSTKTQGSSFTPVRSLKICAIILAERIQTLLRTECILPPCRFLLAVLVEIGICVNVNFDTGIFGLRNS